MAIACFFLLLKSPFFGVPCSLCLSYKDAAKDLVPSLKWASIDLGTPQDITFHLASSPEKAQLEGVPTSEDEIPLLTTMLSSTRDVELLLNGISKENIPMVKKLGPVLKNVSALTLRCDNPTGDFLDAVCSLISNAKNLKRLDIPWFAETNAIFLTTSPTLERLDLCILDDLARPKLSQISGGLQLMSGLKMLILPERCAEVVSAVEDSGQGRLAKLQVSLKNLASALPSCLESLHDVFISTTQRGLQTDVPMFGFLFAHTLSKAVCPFLLKNIFACGIDKASYDTGNTALQFLLMCQATPPVIEGDRTTMEKKIERLLSSGADPFRFCDMPGLYGRAFVNSFHLAAVFCEDFAMIEFLDVTKKRNCIISPETMRTSEGLTPLHMAGHSCDTWNVMLQHFSESSWPDMLTDTNNFASGTPIMTLHLVRKSWVSPSAVIEICEGIFQDESLSDLPAIVHDQKRVFPYALDFYSFHYRRPTIGRRDYSEIEEEEAAQSFLCELYNVFSGERYTTASASVTVGADRVCFSRLIPSESCQDAVIAESSPRVLSCALVQECQRSVDPDRVQKLLTAGAVAWFNEHPTLHPALFMLTSNRIPVESEVDDEEQMEEILKTDIQEFWEVFWILVEAKAPLTINDNGKYISIFDERELVDFIEREDQSAQLQNIREWLSETGATADLARLEAALMKPAVVI
jgi:hypothetical protein